MKLELKHLTPYLPYNVGYTHKYLDLNVTYGELDTKNIIELINPSTNHCIILRPLSDLKTSHNIFEDKAICFIDESDNGGSFTIDDIYFKYKESSFSDWRNAYLLLLENHFDVFGLIEKGLAIDINTIE